MATSIQEPAAVEAIYPESDGKPMADNTRQFRCIVTIQGGLDALFQDRPDVFVAGDLLWYPVEGRPDIVTAPDVLVVFGRPKGDRGSYLQWREGNIAPQVVFEVLSPGNKLKEMARKFEFYNRYGIEEYYLYDPSTGDLTGWQRTEGQLRVIEEMQGWVSPRLGVRFERRGADLILYRPDGTPFATYVELTQQWERERAAREQAQAAAARERAAREEAQAAAARERAAREEAQAAATKNAARAERLAARLRALGIEPEDV